MRNEANNFLWREWNRIEWIWIEFGEIFKRKTMIKQTWLIEEKCN